jgi:hypothetical protein
VDLCRQSIVFDTACDLSACLAAIYWDTGVQVLRIKN